MNFDYLLRRLTGRLRKVLIRISYDVQFGDRVYVSAGAHIRTFDGGRVVIGAGCDIHAGSLIEARGGVVTIGPRSIVNRQATIVAGERIEIGPDALIAEGVTIRDRHHARHTKPYNLAGMVGAPVTIGVNVWIGAKASILAGVRLPDDIVVGAGAVVTKSPPQTGILLGVPARLHRSSNGEGSAACVDAG
ncbi:acyltransferase [Sphingomonas sp.]|uniref:acyltransferase n=1 Tax=Sphingomonas sp. TaxID=28214 RepID=UPI003B3A4DEA